MLSNILHILLIYYVYYVLPYSTRISSWRRRFSPVLSTVISPVSSIRNRNQSLQCKHNIFQQFLSKNYSACANKSDFQLYFPTQTILSVPDTWQFITFYDMIRPYQSTAKTRRHFPNGNPGQVSCIFTVIYRQKSGSNGQHEPHTHPPPDRKIYPPAGICLPAVPILFRHFSNRYPDIPWQY